MVRLAALLGTALLISGCSPPAAEPSPGQASPAAPSVQGSSPETPAPTSEPAGETPLPSGNELIGLAATVELTSAGVRGAFSVEDGGSLEAAAPDGTTYRLTIPAGALLHDALVTLTPLTSVSGEHIDGLVGGVDLQPSGLQLRQPALLEIEPARDVPPERHVPFMYSGDGSLISLGYFALGQPGLAVLIPHFSGSGVLESTDARLELNRKLAESEAASASALHARVAEAILAARDRGETDVSGIMDVMFQAYLEFYNIHLQPRMEFAERLSTSRNPADLEYIAGVVNDALQLERGAQLLGTSLAVLYPEMWADISAWITRVTDNVFEGMKARCVEEHDFTVIPIVLQLLRGRQLLGADDEQMDDEVRRCLRFDVRFESRVVVTNSDGASYVAFPTKAEVEVPWSGRDMLATTLRYDPTDWSGDPGPWCHTEVIEVTDGQLTVITPAFIWKGNNMTPTGPRLRADGRQVPPDDVELYYDIGEALLRQRTIDGGGCKWSVDTLETDVLKQAWRQLHEADATSGVGGWTVTEWEMLFDGELVARKRYDRDMTAEICLMQILCGDNRVSEETTFELVHAPGD